MLNYIWVGMLVISFVAAAFTGRVPQVCTALTQGAGDAVELSLGIAGVMALWTGVMKAAEESGLVKSLAGALSPLIRLLFPDSAGNPEAAGAIAMNMTANFFGMGNAATPFGIKAMKELAKSSRGGAATNSMCMLAVVNSASIQLIPSTLIAIRSSMGSASPSEIIVPIWIASAVSFASGVIASRLSEGRQ